MNQLEVKEPTQEESSEKQSLRRIILNPLVCSIAAALGIFGGISSLFAGLICVILEAVWGSGAGFGRVGTILLISSIPTLLIGVTFLDEIKAQSEK